MPPCAPRRSDPRMGHDMKVWKKAALTTTIVLAVGVPPASAAPASAGPARAAAENGTPVTVPAASAAQKRAACTAANRTVALTAAARKTIKGRVYGVEATRTLSLCTTKKNRTRVYATELSLKPINGMVKVSVTAGATSQVVRNGVTTVTTPLTAKAKFLFKTYRVTGTLRTVVDRAGRVRSQVLNVQRV